MYQHLVRNEEGGPMYIENVMDAQEQEEAYCEEMQMRADDPIVCSTRYMKEKETV